MSETHAQAAERLLARSRTLRAASADPDAAGSGLRKGWRRSADALMAEAQVHAALALADAQAVEPGPGGTRHDTPHKWPKPILPDRSDD